MNELEMEIGRTLGSSAFFIYQFIKNNPRVTSKDIQCETGLSEHCVWMTLNKLKDTNVVRFSERVAGYRKSKMYVENEAKETWKFH